MNKTSYQIWHEEQMNDPEYAVEYKALGPRYEVIRQLIEERNKQNLTQKELAKRIGVHQSNIARFESGDYNPTLDFLQRMAVGIGKQVNIIFR